MARHAALIATVMLLIGCAQTPKIEVFIPDFPAVPEALMEEPQPLKTLRD